MRLIFPPPSLGLASGPESSVIHLENEGLRGQLVQPSLSTGKEAQRCNDQPFAFWITLPNTLGSRDEVLVPEKKA